MQSAATFTLKDSSLLGVCPIEHFLIIPTTLLFLSSQAKEAGFSI